MTGVAPDRGLGDAPAQFRHLLVAEVVGREAGLLELVADLGDALMKSSLAPSLTITDLAFSSSMAALPSAAGLRSQDFTASASASVSSSITVL